MNAQERETLRILVKAARSGGKIVRKYFGQALKIVEKSTLADFQTQADLESEESILKILKKEFPTYNLFTEEGGETNKNSDYTLVIDPLDGTNNFVVGLPTFSVSIGLLYKDEPVAGVVYQPILNDTYTAYKNRGAYLNGRKIKVNKVTDYKKITIFYTNGYKTDLGYHSKMMGSLVGGKHKRVINNWSAACEYCMLARGKVESVVTDGIELHDFAAGKLIAMEAGAQVIDFTGKKEKNYTNNFFIISNTPEINKYILGFVKPLQKGRQFE